MSSLPELVRRQFWSKKHIGNHASVKPDRERHTDAADISPASYCRYNIRNVISESFDDTHIAVTRRRDIESSEANLTFLEFPRFAIQPWNCTGGIKTSFVNRSLSFWPIESDAKFCFQDAFKLELVRFDSDVLGMLPRCTSWLT